jgi:hypothetical protein
VVLLLLHAGAAAGLLRCSGSVAAVVVLLLLHAGAAAAATSLSSFSWTVHKNEINQSTNHKVLDLVDLYLRLHENEKCTAYVYCNITFLFVFDLLYLRADLL